MTHTTEGRGEGGMMTHITQGRGEGGAKAHKEHPMCRRKVYREQVHHEYTTGRQKGTHRGHTPQRSVYCLHSNGDELPTLVADVGFLAASAYLVIVSHVNVKN